MEYLLLLSSSVAACSTQETGRSSTTLTAEQQVILAATSKCGLPADRLQPVGDGRVILKPDPNDDYKKIDCLLAEVGKAPKLKLGFIGNERYEENSQ